MVYSSATYATLEISPALAALQAQTVSRDGGHGAAFLPVAGDAADAAAWARLRAALPPQHQAGGGGGGGGSSVIGGHCFVVMTEVLDNLPHDRWARVQERAGFQAAA